MPAFFVVMGYLSGSVLYARVFAGLFRRSEALAQSKDGNPGAANAFQYGGFWCGLLTLGCDLLKGLLPVHLYMKEVPYAFWGDWPMALILAAPVVGHAFPLFYRFQGGKGIAVTFGCLLGLLPLWKPVIILAFFFVFFSLVIRISPHLYRTMAAYGGSLIWMALGYPRPMVVLGFLLMTVVVMLRLHMSREERESLKVHLLWIR